MSDASAVISLSAALVAGAVGSLHCLAMCGGLAGALGMRSRSTPAAALRDASLYHCGRLAGYGLAGALFGLVGATLVSTVNLPLLAATARVGAGVLLVLAALKVLFGWNLLSFIERAGAQYWKALQPVARRAMTASGATRSLIVGLLWGWLPCGLVYSMLAFAALSGDSLQGAAIMVAFGLGTMPAMLTSSAFAARLGGWIRQRGTRQLGGVMLLLFGCWIAWSAIPWVHHHHEGVRVAPAFSRSAFATPARTATSLLSGSRARLSQERARTTHYPSPPGR